MSGRRLVECPGCRAAGCPACGWTGLAVVYRHGSTRACGEGECAGCEAKQADAEADAEAADAEADAEAAEAEPVNGADVVCWAFTAELGWHVDTVDRQLVAHCDREARKAGRRRGRPTPTSDQARKGTNGNDRNSTARG